MSAYSGWLETDLNKLMRLEPDELTEWRRRAGEEQKADFNAQLAGVIDIVDAVLSRRIAGWQSPAPWEAGTDQQTEPASVMPPTDDDTEPADITDDDKQTAERITALGQTDAFGNLRGFT